MSDELNQLTDAQLSEVFAVEVAGWKRGDVRWPPGEADETAGWIPPGEKSPRGYPCCPSFATSADAVLPFVHKAGWAECLQWDMENGKPTAFRWRVRVVGRRGGYIEGEAPTFARAACIALIRAKRST